MINIIKKIFGSKPKVVISPDTLLLDVRNPNELIAGSIHGALNIPLNNIEQSIHKLKGYTDVVVFCRSGSRAEKAMHILKAHGIANVTNGGSWSDVEKLLRSTE